MSGTRSLALSFVTIHPDCIASYLNFGVFRAAMTAGSLQCQVVNLRDFASDNYASVDDRPYGGGDGMIMRPDILAAATQSFAERPYVILPSPAGKVFAQQDVRRLLDLKRPIAFVCGRFGGVDQRFIDSYVDEEISLGSFVVSGGELPALMIADAMVRHLPGALGHAASADVDSFSTYFAGGLEHPSFTRPAVFEGQEVPRVLLSGDHLAIEQWRRRQSLELTRARRPDLLT